MTTTSPFASALDAAIADQPLTLERISARLKAAGTPASVTTLSYWKTGRSAPTRSRSREVLAELDHILGLEPGALAAHLDACPSWPPHQVLPGADDTSALLDELNVGLRRHWTKVTTHDRLIVDAQGHEVRQVSRQLLRADVDGAQRWPIVLEQDSGLPGSVATIVPLAGMSLAEVRQLPERHLTVAAAEVPFPVPRGTMIAVEFEIEWGPQAEASHRMELCLPAQSGTVVLEVQFQRPPAYLRRYHRGTDPGERTTYTDDVTCHDGWAQAVLCDAPAGLHGLTWDW